MSFRLPKITLVTPSFNQGRFLEKTLVSVLSQEYPKLEYIVMDGGSTDGSVEIIEKYAERLTHWHSEKDGGQGDAILRGWAMGTGEMIGWLNSDDVLLPGALHRLARLYATGKYQIVTGEQLCIEENDRIHAYQLKWRGPTWMFRAALLHPGQPGTFYDRSAAEAVDYFDKGLSCAMEFDLVLRMLQEGARIGILHSPVSALRHHLDTKSNKLRAQFKKENREVFGRLAAFPFGNTMLRERLVKWMRYPYAVRYLNPLRVVDTARKIAWSLHSTVLPLPTELPTDSNVYSALKMLGKRG